MEFQFILLYAIPFIDASSLQRSNFTAVIRLGSPGIIKPFFPSHFSPSTKHERNLLTPCRIKNLPSRSCKPRLPFNTCNSNVNAPFSVNVFLTHLALKLCEIHYRSTMKCHRLLCNFLDCKSSSPLWNNDIFGRLP